MAKKAPIKRPFRGKGPLGGNMFGKFGGQVLMTLLIFMLIVGLYAAVSEQEGKTEEISISEVALDVSAGLVESIVVRDNALSVQYADDLEKKSRKETGTALSEIMAHYGVTAEELQAVKISVESPTGVGYWLLNILPFLIPILFIILFFWFISKQVRGASMQAFTFGQSRARIIDPNDNKQRVTFDDVAGVKEAKEELLEIVDFLRNPKKFLDIGARIPKGVLMIGAPGTGKTILARAIAGQARVPFFYLSGSEFVEMFVGVGASVTGDTPVLVKTKNGAKLLPIKDVVDPYYQNGESDFVKPAGELKTLGFKPLASGFRGENSKQKKMFGGSQWSQAKGVLRHKVDEVYVVKYRGGTIRTTGDHSVFVRDKNMIKHKKAEELQAGDILVNLPFKVRSHFIPGLGTTHKVRAHEFATGGQIYLDLYTEKHEQVMAGWQYALASTGHLSQAAVGSAVGVSQATIGNWQKGIHLPQFMNNSLLAAKTPGQLAVTTDLMRLFGYYTAEGRTMKYCTEWVFGLHEKALHEDCAGLIKSIFKISPRLTPVPETNSLRINISSPIVADFFHRHLSTGSHHKHVPEFIWDLPREYFLAYLEGYAKGDGYITKDGKLSMTSVSRQLIQELAWLCSMHGIQTGIRKTVAPAGRTIRHRDKPLPETTAWNLIIGRSSNPFVAYDGPANQFKKPIVESVTKENYDGYVYDLCGCDHEAFFGGDKPLLLHNSRVRDLFKMAKKAAPAIIFIDEIDAIGRHRGSGMGGGNDEREQTLNQILVEMDGFEPTEKLIVVSATNRPDVLDPALLRPGRFDRRVILELPDIKDREAILKVNIKKKPLAPDVDLRVIAERTPGFSGADLANVMNEAAILTAREDRKQVSQYDLIRSVEKVMLGPERKSHILSIQEKKITAYHEMGHALVASVLPKADPVHKVSIISRGHAAGYTLKLPFEDKKLNTKGEFLDDIAMSLGGYAAERMIFGDITTGASNDIEVSTRLARSMVTKYGMSDKVGPVAYGSNEGRLTPSVRPEPNASESIQSVIDAEVARIMSEALARAEKVLLDHRSALDNMSQELIKVETLEREDFEKLLIVNGIKPKERQTGPESAPVLATDNAEQQDR